jgi:hypothetical protein
MNFVGKERALSGSALKLVAMAAMVIDRVALIFFCNNPEHSTTYELMRTIGRISYPVFAFLVVEGYLHTHDFGRYAKRLLYFAIVSEIPWQLINHDGSHNVLFTLLAGLFVLYMIEHWHTTNINISLFAIITGVLLIYIHTDYDWRGLLLILIFYLFKKDPLFQTVFGILVMSFYGFTGALLAFMVINAYNGHRGFIQGDLGKHLVYLFYPCHLLLLWTVGVMILNRTA